MYRLYYITHVLLMIFPKVFTSNWRFLPLVLRYDVRFNIKQIFPFIDILFRQWPPSNKNSAHQYMKKKYYKITEMTSISLIFHFNGTEIKTSKEKKINIKIPFCLINMCFQLTERGHLFKTDVHFVHFN